MLEIQEMLLPVFVLQAHAILVPGQIPPSAAQLQSDLDAAIAARVPKFTIPPGEYMFNESNASLIIDGATDIEIVGTGATVWLSPGHWAFAFVSVPGLLLYIISFFLGRREGKSFPEI